MSWWSDFTNTFGDILKAESNPASLPSDIASFFSSAGEDIFNGLTTAFEKIFQDLWNEVSGAVEIFAAVVLFVIAVAFVFKDQLISLAPLAAAAG